MPTVSLFFIGLFWQKLPSVIIKCTYEHKNEKKNRIKFVIFVTMTHSTDNVVVHGKRSISGQLNANQSLELPKTRLSCSRERK